MGYKKRLIGGALQGVLLFREDGNGNVVPADVGFVDEVSGALTVIEFPHHELHEGHHFTVSDRVTLGSAATREFLITTPNSDLAAHMLFTISSSLGITIDFYETTTKTGGTGLTVFNNNRRSGTTAVTTITHTPAGAGDGTLIYQDSSGGTGAARAAGGLRGENEWVLKQNTKYLLRITSGANSNVVSTQFHFYEHIPFVSQ